MRARTRRTAVVAAVSSLVLLGAATAWAASDTPWAQSDADAAHSRANAAETTLSASNVASLQYLRSVLSRPSGPDDICEGGQIASAPVIAGGRLYEVVSDHLKAFTLSTGAQVWDAPLDTSSTSIYVSVAKSGNTIVVGAHDCISQSDPNGYMWAINATTGAQLWQSAGAPIGGTLDDLVISGAYVVAESGGAASSDPYVAVHALSTGATVWSRTTCPATTERAKAIVVDGKVIYPKCNLDDSSNPSLVAATLATGVVSWQKSGAWIPEAGDSDATTAHHLYARSATGVADLNPASGATRYSIAGAAVHALAVDAQNVYVSCAAGICARTRATGAALWSTSTGSNPPILAVADGVVYTSDGDALLASNGAVLTTILGAQASALSVGDGYLAVQTDPRIVDVYGLAGS